MKPLDPDKVPHHVARQRGGRTGLVHGLAPEYPRSFTRAHPDRLKPGRKGAKARSKMKKIMLRRFGVVYDPGLA